MYVSFHLLATMRILYEFCYYCSRQDQHQSEKEEIDRQRKLLLKRKPADPGSTTGRKRGGGRLKQLYVFTQNSNEFLGESNILQNVSSLISFFAVLFFLAEIAYYITDLRLS